jgi:Cu(I)/Ag(I) efflux system periplasmic protein CusF
MSRSVHAPRLIFATIVTLSLPFTVAALSSGCGKSASTEAQKTYTTKGTIKSFGPDRKLVNIAHEAIPGYMSAMTMSFEPKTPDLVNGLAAGDKVTFTFAADGGKHVITAISKAP